MALEAVNPVWIAAGISAVGTVVGWIVSARAARHGTEIALARFEERQNNMGQHLGRLQDQVSMQGGLLGEHAVRLGVLENAVDVRPPPVDYPRRGR